MCFDMILNKPCVLNFSVCTFNQLRSFLPFLFPLFSYFLSLFSRLFLSILSSCMKYLTLCLYYSKTDFFLCVVMYVYVSLPPYSSSYLSYKLCVYLHLPPFHFLFTHSAPLFNLMCSPNSINM